MTRLTSALVIANHPSGVVLEGCLPPTRIYSYLNPTRAHSLAQHLQHSTLHRRTMLFRNLFAFSASFSLAISQVQGAVLPRAEVSTCPASKVLDAMLPIMKQLDCEINRTKDNIAAHMASSPDTNAQVDDAIVIIAGKMLDASSNVRKLNWTAVETYARSADGSRLLSPEEIGPASGPYFSNIVSLMTVIRDYVHSKHQAHSHKRLVSLMQRIEYVYGYSATLMAGSEDYVSFASAVNFTGELHIQGGASVLNVQLNNIKLGLYNGEWEMQSSEAAGKITALNSTLSNP
ncbi:unnamed protein product [Rhizoctonia solani]|uniref:Uncharacterized protein n=1 Tax=Rhizoctonia solani TaxID=456999 RepID=A0A8H3H900_9AGAM|nr:unnamed protein product [Rhizoctonia solani]